MTQLLGSNVDAGSNLTVNALTPRAWNFAVTANGNADTLFFKANNTTTYKFGVYAVPSLAGTPTTLLATTASVVATAGNIYSVALSVPIAMSVGQFYSLAAKPLATGSIRGTASPTANQRNSGPDAAYADPFDATWSNTGGASGSTPAIWLEATVVSIVSINKIEAGSLCTAETSSSSFAATSVDITVDGVTKTVAATDIGGGEFTFIAPEWVASTTALKYGACSLIATDGAINTPEFTSVPLTLASPLASVDLTSVSANSLDKIGSFSPAWVVNTQVVYDSSKITVYANGECNTLIFDGVYWVDSGFEGVTQVWGRDPTDKIARMSNVTISAGAPVVSGGGLTARGLTVSGLTVRGLTVTGL